MRPILLVALFAAGAGVQAGEAPAQVGGVQPKPSPTAGTPTTNTPTAKTAAKTPAAGAAAEIAARPDGFRYFWHNGEWWYFTAQNNWLRWDGKAWVVHHSINDSGAFSPGPQPQAQTPMQTQPNGATSEAAPGTDNGISGPSYRYDINRRKGGL